ncbi:MAG: cell division protein SepF [Acholeplasmatales bacterium]|jgi:cell division inhibitor SepF|nr:cell division protein SepF [Acholeplasmatales bacterium]
MCFRKREKELKKPPTASLIVIKQLLNSDNDELVNIGDELVQEKPLIINFDKLNEREANKAIAFFSGISFAKKGEVKTINDKTFLFTTSDSFLDGTLEKYLSKNRLI